MEKKINLTNDEINRVLEALWFRRCSVHKELATEFENIYLKIKKQTKLS